jgi:hypothetical protein
MDQECDSTQSSINESSNELLAGIEALGSVARELIKRLRPVSLTADLTCEKDDALAEDHPRCGLDESLRSYSIQVREIRDSLAQALDLLQI